MIAATLLQLDEGWLPLVLIKTANETSNFAETRSHGCQSRLLRSRKTSDRLAVDPNRVLRIIPDVNVAGRQPHSHADRQPNHRARPSDSAATSDISVAAPTEPVIRIRTPAADSISIAVTEGAVNGLMIWRNGDCRKADLVFDAAKLRANRVNIMAFSDVDETGPRRTLLDDQKFPCSPRPLSSLSTR